MSPDPRLLIAQSQQREAMMVAIRADLAARILSAILAGHDSHPEVAVGVSDDATRRRCAYAVAVADALLAELSRPPSSR